MDEQKPHSVRVFDCLYWLSMIVTGFNILVNMLASSRSAFADGFEVLRFIPVTVWIVTSIALWYFASIRKSIIALFLIGGIVVSKVLFFYNFYSNYVVPSWVSILIDIGPLLLLVVAISAMMTPTAKSWRISKNHRLSKIFE